MKDKLSSEEKSLLLRLARKALETGVRGEKLPPLNLDELPERLRRPGASFVTLTYQGMLRGCIGALQPRQIAHAQLGVRERVRMLHGTHEIESQPRAGTRISIKIPRAVQVTTDLAGFWTKHYPGIAKELRRKYPRHKWPEDPA